MKRGSIQALTPLIHQYILDELTKGTRPSVLAGLVAGKWQISVRKAETHLARVKAELTERVGNTKDTICATLHERFEQQYRDTEGISELVPRIDIQRKVASSHADLFGFGRQRGDVQINIDMRGLIPEPIQRALQPIVYEVEAVETSEDAQ